MRMTPQAMLVKSTLALSLTLALGACNRNDDTDATAAATDTTQPAANDASTYATADAGTGSLVTAGTGEGTYLTDNTGRALYVLEGDDTGTRCAGDCLAAWPLVAGAAPVSGVPDVDGAMIATTTRSDGSTQVTYAGHPLYYFANDTGPGTTLGQNVSDDWGRWHLVRPNGELVSVSAMGGTSTTPMSDTEPSDTSLSQPAAPNDTGVDVDTDSEETEPPTDY
jgi:predicted lipoprotein with Yx(FWY)xxD motif